MVISADFYGTGRLVSFLSKTGRLVSFHSELFVLVSFSLLKILWRFSDWCGRPPFLSVAFLPFLYFLSCRPEVTCWGDVSVRAGWKEKMRINYALSETCSEWSNSISFSYEYINVVTVEEGAFWKEFWDTIWEANVAGPATSGGGGRVLEFTYWFQQFSKTQLAV